MRASFTYWRKTLLALPIMTLCMIGFAAENPTPANPDSSSTLHWSDDPVYATIKPRVSYVPGIKVIRGKTQVIVPEHKSFCPAGSVFRFNNGDIQVHNQRSFNGGETWEPAEYVLESSTYQFPGEDGEVIMFKSSYTSEHSTGAGRPEVAINKTDEVGVYDALFFRSTNNGLTRVSDPAKIYMPEWYQDWTGVLCRKIIGLEDGTLLMSMYGRKEKAKGVDNQFRSMVLRSSDRGKTWYYLSTIAFDQKESVRSEGFDETTLLVLPDGTIFSFLRSGASYQSSMGSSNNGDWSIKMPFAYGPQSPIYMNASTDGGQSWSTADPISPYGVWPDALLMDNGLLVSSYGRPGNWMMFSQDRGETWGPIIPFEQGLYPPDCGNYFAMAEVAPNTLLVVYARTNPNDHWQSEFVGTYFRVERGEVEYKTDKK